MNRRKFTAVGVLSSALPLFCRAEEKIEDKFDFTFDDIAYHVVVIECESDGNKIAGSGFIALDNDAPYLYTNQHVILGADKINFTTTTGYRIKPRGIELAATRDIARFPLSDEDGFAIADRVSMGTPVAVFGNSEGQSVATELYGKITGVGADIIEVSADFVSGNSGSPVLNAKKEVVGIASYVRESREHGMKKGTRFENSVRRFCYRVDRLDWMKVNWKKYNDKYGKLYFQSSALVDGIVEIINTWSDKPHNHIALTGTAERALTSWAASHNDIILKKDSANFDADYGSSVLELASLCKGRSRQTRMFSEQRELTGFLREEFEKQSRWLGDAAENIERFGKEMIEFGKYR